jgi:sigma-B regulation protein RsbU (phosphoserine phosphatase)
MRAVNVQNEYAPSVDDYAKASAQGQLVSTLPIEWGGFLIPGVDVRQLHFRAEWLCCLTAMKPLSATIPDLAPGREGSLDELKESSDFLCALLENINSAVLIVDEELCIYQFNNAFLSLFGATHEGAQLAAFGQAAGCVNTILEKKDCGKTRECPQCVFRGAIREVLEEDKPIKSKIVKHTFMIEGVKTVKYLEISARPLEYHHRRMTLVVVYDVTELVEKKRQLRRKQEILDQDLKAAAGIQRTMLPASDLRIAGLDLAWRFRPSIQVGGDIFGIQQLDGDRYGVFMLDVCGHGVAAGLIAVGVSQFLQTRYGVVSGKESETDPAAIVRELNTIFPFSRFTSFFSLVYLVVDRRTGVVDSCCAGHPPPMLLRADGSVETLEVTGPVVGLDPGSIFTTRRIELGRGESLLLYTDGVTELANPNGGRYGEEALGEAVGRAHPADAESLVDTICAELDLFASTASAEDDVTLLAVRYEG